MPTLQIDGIPIADIDERNANELLNRAKKAMSTVMEFDSVRKTESLSFQRQVTEPRGSVPVIDIVTVRLEFDVLT